MRRRTGASAPSPRGGYKSNRRRGGYRDWTGTHPFAVRRARDRRLRGIVTPFERELVEAAHAEHTDGWMLETLAGLLTVARGCVAARLRQGYGGQPSRGLPTVAHAYVGKRERRLVDGRRLELPTSALRTNGGSGRIWLDRNGVGSARRQNRADAAGRVFTRVSA